MELTAEVKFLMFIIGDNNANSIKDIYQAARLYKEIKIKQEYLWADILPLKSFKLGWSLKLVFLQRAYNKVVL